MKLMWNINCFTRLKHLKLNQHLVRSHYGNDLYIRVFANNPALKEEDYHYLENKLQYVPHNNGHHNGSLQSWNAIVDEVRESDFDIIVWTHADSIFSDYTLADMTFKNMLEAGKEVAVLEYFERENPRKGGMAHWTYCDFIVMTKSMYLKVFPFSANCD